MRIAALYAAALGLALLTGPAHAAGPDEKVFRLTIVNGAVPPEARLLRVIRNDRVRIVIAADAPCTLHLHGYGLEAVLPAGGQAEWTLEAKATGRFPIHRHGTADSTGGHHHDQPLAHLEVRPR